MAAIKKFFEKRKMDIKFKKAGEGQRLDASSTSMSVPVASMPVAARGSDLTKEQRMAADAALARLSQPKAGSSSGNKTNLSLRAQIIAEKKATEQTSQYSSGGPQQVDLDAAPVAGRVLFRCQLIGSDVALPREQMEAQIEAFLLSQLPEEPAMTSALMICTLSRNPDTVKQCIETISKYLENIATHPGEEKYRRIRTGNKVLQERVLPLRGAEEFLQAAGFKRMTQTQADGTSDEFLVFEPGQELNESRLLELREILNNAEPIRPELDRSIGVFHPSANAFRMSVPDEFFRVSVDEIRREQQARNEAVEKLGMLRTREMRERDRLKELRRYRYCLIRVRFPDGILLQGTFYAGEKLSSLTAFVAESLENDWLPFYLMSTTGQKLTDENSTLAELDLAPASLVNLTFDESVMKDVAAAEKGERLVKRTLKEELLEQISSL